MILINVESIIGQNFNKFTSYHIIFQIIFYVRDRDRMKGIEAFPERGKGLPGGKSMDGEGSPASSGNHFFTFAFE